MRGLWTDEDSRVSDAARKNMHDIVEILMLGRRGPKRGLEDKAKAWALVHRANIRLIRDYATEQGRRVGLVGISTIINLQQQIDFIEGVKHHVKGR